MEFKATLKRQQEKEVGGGRNSNIDTSALLSISSTLTVHHGHLLQHYGYSFTSASAPNPGADLRAMHRKKPRLVGSRVDQRQTPTTGDR
jgi:hypothetical protein